MRTKFFSGIIRFLDLISELNRKLPEPETTKASYLPLLRGYVKSKLLQEAEAFMKKLNGLGLLVTPHPFSEMMKLYEATQQYEKVVLVVPLMKRNKTPRNVLSYNLWMNACCEVSGVESVYKEMVGDKSVEVGWSSLCTLANVYVKAGFVDKASLVLENAEKKLNRSNSSDTSSSSHSMRNKEGVVRLWEGSKSVSGRATCANYICVLSFLVKLGDLVEAERVFSEWDDTCCNYDVRVSNVLLGAYMRDGDIRKAEGIAPPCIGERRPSQNIFMAIAEYFEKEEKIDEADGYVRDLHRLSLASLPLYRLLLRMHEHVQRPAFHHVYEMMKLDKTRKVE
ncbi:LOW QUALITY PROTEIN: hypothetical protein N665_0278s0026 [Sinapis alba]|nr:LOW QUALITY PROTEIN: hypothetical protein N665_0278s0026 [Sinapis alba]